MTNIIVEYPHWYAEGKVTVFHKGFTTGLSVDEVERKLMVASRKAIESSIFNEEFSAFGHRFPVMEYMICSPGH